MTLLDAGSQALPLAGRRVVVLGAAGEVGEGLVHNLMSFGADVIAVSRSAERLAALQRVLDTIRGDPAPAGSVAMHLGDVGHEAGALQLRDDLLAKDGSFDAVVASLGGWRQGPTLTNTTLTSWSETLDQSLTAHFLAARSLLPVIADRVGASYTLINGGAALRAVPGAGAMCVSAAGQRMLAEALATEHRDRAVRVNALLLDAYVRTRSRPTMRGGTISADDVGTYAAYLVSTAAKDVDGEIVVLDHPRGVLGLPTPFGRTAISDTRSTGRADRSTLT